jgi:hypothetical protein
MPISGPQSDRAATLKQAFANQFKSHFVSATLNDSAYKPATIASSSSFKRAEAKEASNGSKQKKSRWDNE